MSTLRKQEYEKKAEGTIKIVHVLITKGSEKPETYLVKYVKHR